MESTEMDDKYPEMNYFLNESKSDIIFLIDGQRIPALKVLMSMKSQVFEAMFSGNFRESDEKEIEIKDTTAEAFKVMLRFVYCEKFVIPDDNNYLLVTEVCKLADKYQMRRLIDAIGEHFKSKVINVSNFEAISEFGFGFNINVLIESLNEFIEKNFKTFIVRSTEELMTIDDLTRNTLLKVVVKNYHKMERYLTGLMRGQPEIYVNGICYKRYGGHRSDKNLFNFDKMHENNY